MDNAKHQDESHVNSNETLLALGKLQGIVETGFAELKQVQAATLEQTRLTNGSVRELKEWRASHEAETKVRLAEWQVHKEELRETAAQVRTLQDAERDRQKEIDRKVKEAADIAAREKRVLQWFAAIGGVGGAISIFALAKQLFIK